MNDLERRGLVERRVDPGNRRMKIVELTDAGSAVLVRMAAVRDAAPPGVQALDLAELRELQQLLSRIAGVSVGDPADRPERLERTVGVG